MNPCCDYAHYYLGCRYKFTWHDGDYVEAILGAILYDGMLMADNIADNKKGTVDNPDDIDWFEVMDFRTEGNFQLYLIDTHDITKEQMATYKSLCFQIKDLIDDKKIVRYADTPESMDYLFRNGIDAFNLIERGYALDAYSIPNHKPHMFWAMNLVVGDRVRLNEEYKKEHKRVKYLEETGTIINLSGNGCVKVKWDSTNFKTPYESHASHFEKVKQNP